MRMTSIKARLRVLRAEREGRRRYLPYLKPGLPETANWKKLSPRLFCLSDLATYPPTRTANKTDTGAAEEHRRAVGCANRVQQHKLAASRQVKHGSSGVQAGGERECTSAV